MGAVEGKSNILTAIRPIAGKGDGGNGGDALWLKGDGGNGGNALVSGVGAPAENRPSTAQGRFSASGWLTGLEPATARITTWCSTN